MKMIEAFENPLEEKRNIYTFTSVFPSEEIMQRAYRVLMEKEPQVKHKKRRKVKLHCNKDKGDFIRKKRKLYHKKNR